MMRVATEFQDETRSASSFDVAMIRTGFEENIQIIDENGDRKIDEDTSGLTRMRCGTNLYESHEFMNNQEGRLYSVFSAEKHPAIILALLQCTRSAFSPLIRIWSLSISFVYLVAAFPL